VTYDKIALEMLTLFDKNFNALKSSGFEGMFYLPLTFLPDFVVKDKIRFNLLLATHKNLDQHAVNFHINYKCHNVVIPPIFSLIWRKYSTMVSESHRSIPVSCNWRAELYVIKIVANYIDPIKSIKLVSDHKTICTTSLGLSLKFFSENNVDLDLINCRLDHDFANYYVMSFSDNPFKYEHSGSINQSNAKLEFESRSGVVIKNIQLMVQNITTIVYKHTDKHELIFKHK
jgi:hypothetical protein